MMPSIEKSWQFSSVRFVSDGSTTTDLNNLMFNIKNMFINFPQPWIVKGSSDSSTAGIDSVDRWVTPSNLVWALAANAKSWIVLKHPITSLEILIELVTSTSANYKGVAKIQIANSSFSGGSTTTAPTATGAVTVVSTTAWAWVPTNSSSPTTSYILHGMQSSDGYCSRIIGFNGSSSVIALAILCEQINGPILNPISFSWLSGTTVAERLTYVNISDTARANFFINNDGYTAYFAGPGIINSLIQENSSLSLANELNEQFFISPVYLYGATTGGRGYLGSLYDVWWAPCTSSAVCGGNDTTYPNDNTRKYWSPGCLIFPWDGYNLSPGTFPNIWLD